jgi:Zn-dependent protease with chaperone function
MADNIQRSLRPPRLNPFAFPSDTDFRFVLLIFSVLGATSLIYNVLSSNPLYSQTTAALHCNAPFQARTYRDIEAIFEAQQRYIQCTSPYLHLLIAWLLGGIALVLIVAFVFYWIFPTWKLWQRKLVPLSVEDAPEVVAYLEELSHDVRLVPPPGFVWNPLNQANGALAFGRFRQYYVALSGGLVTQFYTDQPAFRAVLLHELAHLHNADVNKTYFAVALWRAFVVVALIPFAGYLVVQAPFPTILMFNLVFRVLVLAVLVYLTRNAVLRAREVYADVRASTWDGVSGALSRVLAALPHARGHWQALARVHPSPDERCRVLNDTGELFLLSFWEAFGVGIATGVAIPNVQTLLLWLFYSQQVDFSVIVMPNLLGTALIFTPLVVGTVGLNTWRAAFAASARGQALRGAGCVGLCLGLGIILGMFLSLPTAFAGFSFTLLIDLFVYSLPWNVLLLVGLFCFFRWIAAGATVWLGMAATIRALRRIYIVGLTIAGVILVAWSAQLFQFSVFTTLILQFSLLPPAIVLTTLFAEALLQPITLLIVIGLWAFPLAIWFWRDQVIASAGLSWAFMDVSPRQVTLPRQNHLRPGLALIVGLIGGLTFCAILLIVRIGLHLSMLSEAINVNDGLLLVFYFGQVILAVLLQACVAGIVTGLVGKLRSLHGLFAAFVAGCVMTSGLLVLNLLFGGRIDPMITWQTFCFVVNGGAFLALLIAMGVSLLAGWISQPGRQAELG